MLFVGFYEVQLLNLQLKPDLRLVHFGRWNELLRYLRNLILTQTPFLELCGQTRWFVFLRLKPTLCACV
jgi:hypothetical protein